MRGKFFAGRDNAFFTTLSAHPALLPPDTLTTIELNYQWRRFISDAIDRHIDYVSYNLTDTEKEDLLEKVNSMLSDFYQ